jgi:gliding motility-associated-like protein
MKNLYSKNFHYFLLLLALVAGPRALIAQLVIDNAQTPQQLVQNVLLGQGVTATNITFNGQPLQIASFTSTNTNLGLTSGVVMSTGECQIAIGPNNSSGNTLPTTGFNTPGDADLDNISAAGTFDAAVLEFDFIPTSDSIKFRYVFGSEEYLEFVGLGYNDVFAFILSGVSTPMAPTNIALVPGTGTPVSIDNINDVSYPQYYVDNGDGSLSNGTIQFDGFTTVLTAKAAVICGETYHIKLAIADAGDPILDSGVFLEAGSFSSPGAIQISTDVSYSTTNDTTMYEGCGSAAIGFVRSGDNSQPLTVNYTLGGNATNGVDYNNLSGQITIPAGQDTAFLTLTPTADGLPEGVETIVFSVSYTNCNVTTTVTATIYLQDALPMTVSAGNDQSTACTGGNPVQLTATPNGGIGPYTYNWSPTGDITQTISVQPVVTTTYIVTATDLCNSQDSDTVEVSVGLPQPLVLTAANDTTICQNQPANLWANYQGGNGTITLQWNTGEQSSNIQVTPMVTTTYNVTVTDVCNQTATESVTVTVLPNDALFDYLFVTNNTVNFDNQSTGYESGLWWDFGDSTAISTTFEPTHEYASPGVYMVTLVVENAAGCIDTMRQSLVVKPDFYFYIPNAFTPNQDGINETFNGKGQGFEVYNMSIFNRWGQEVFSTNSLLRDWDGSDGGNEIAPVDVYTYVVTIKITEQEDKQIIYRGMVALVR